MRHVYSSMHFDNSRTVFDDSQGILALLHQFSNSSVDFS